MTFYDWFKNLLERDCDLVGETKTEIIYKVKKKFLVIFLPKPKTRNFNGKLGEAVFSIGISKTKEGDKLLTGIGEMMAKFDKDLRKDQK